MNIESVEACIKLGMLPDVGSVSALRLLRKFGSCEAIFKASVHELAEVEKIGVKIARKIVDSRDSIDPKPAISRLERLGGSYITFKDPRYPRALLQIPDFPLGLYVLGNPDFNIPCVSIVGSRKCTRYGIDSAKKFAAVFSRAQIAVVSGMARGIDSAAHLGALDEGGKTFAVLGCGVDVIYPPENSQLYNRIINSGGCIISEFPMGMRADKQCFPIRNRIVSGMSLATVVIESDDRGGSMITARLAAEQGRDVFALPGRVDSIESRGCHALIRDGVTLARNAEDIIDELKFSNKLGVKSAQEEFVLECEPPPNASEKNSFKNEILEASKGDHEKTPSRKMREETFGADIKLSEDESKIYNLLKAGDTMHADEIARTSKLPISKCLSILLMLELKRVLAKGAGGMWQKR